MDVYWLEQSEADLPAADDWLCQGEAAHLRSLRVPKRHADWRLGRYTAKRAVAVYLNLPTDFKTLAAIEIRPAASGAPEVFRVNEPAEVSISISHRATIAACAVAPSEMAIGCDLELIEPRSEGFLTDYFTAGEQELVKRVPAEERFVLANLLWSAKESALKALKVGLRFDIRGVEVSIGENSQTVGADSHKDTTYEFFFNARRHVTDWRPLTVSHVKGQSFRGWWLSNGELVRTVVSVPSASPPRILSAIREHSGS